MDNDEIERVDEFWINNKTNELECTIKRTDATWQAGQSSMHQKIAGQDFTTGRPAIWIAQMYVKMIKDLDSIKARSVFVDKVTRNDTLTDIEPVDNVRYHSSEPQSLGTDPWRP